VSRRTFIIAEAGVNHNGDLEFARRLVDLAADAGADAVKFQSFRADTLARRDAPKAEYQKVTTGTSEGQYEMLRRLELSEDAHRDLAERCRSANIEFMSTPFDEPSADLLERIGVRRYKIASGEITNLFLLRHIAGKRKPVILSTGMSSLADIEAALQALHSAGAQAVSLLHCVSDYPTRPEDVNLRVMQTLKAKFKTPVGLSDHTQGTAVALAAVALGAEVIEKHVTLDRTLPGPDHQASLDPSGLREMIRGIREIEAALGSEEKTLTPGEASTQRVARRSLVLRAELAAGTVLQAAHLTAKRPGTGISPMELDRVVGRKLKRSMPADALVSWDDLA
jgi:N-acetylneuraminate synthase/N,N'-diacetyllegionaminate synthase